MSGRTSRSYYYYYYYYLTVQIRYLIKINESNNLPKPKEGTIFIVDEMVARLCPERDDFYVMGMPGLRSGNVSSISVLTPI